MLPDALQKARDLLKDITPLRGDCGELCAAACCASREGEETGMLLFPGEEKVYRGQAGYTLTETDHGILLTCPGHCDRDHRPLACRMFPLVILLRPDGVKVATDEAAKSVCPLARQGKKALSEEFVRVVREAGRCLALDEGQAAHLRLLTAMQDELRNLRAQYGRKQHV